MSVKIGKGVPPSAKFDKIIEDLFQNEKTIDENKKIIITLSLAEITSEQKQSLIYPLGFNPLHIYIIYQTDTLNANKEIINTVIRLVSFANKNDKFIYGFYFDIFAQNRFSIKLLKESCKAIPISPNARFLVINYIEVYNDVVGTVVILALFNGIDGPFAGLQYSHKDHFFIERLFQRGISQTNLPKIDLTGLSQNLSHFKCH